MFRHIVVNLTGTWLFCSIQNHLNFYSYDFTVILRNDGSSVYSDIKIDLESVDVLEDNEEEEAVKMKPVSPVVGKEITNTLIQQKAACIVTDDDWISFILK